MDLSKFSLAGKTAVVTGGNGGIGLGMAQGLAKAGAAVAIWARNESKNEEAMATLRGLGAAPIALVVDVADEESVAAASRATLEHFGSIDVLVANAGVSGAGLFPEQFPLEEWDRVMDINAGGVFLTTRAISQVMIDQGTGGSIIVVASTAGLLGNPSGPHYSASKGAALAMTRALAVRLARYGIRVNAVAPGYIRTDMTDPMVGNEKFEEIAIRYRTTMRRWGEVEEFEGPAVFLASDASSYVNGATLVVDAGFTIM